MESCRSNFENYHESKGENVKNIWQVSLVQNTWQEGLARGESMARGSHWRAPWVSGYAEKKRNLHGSSRCPAGKSRLWTAASRSSAISFAVDAANSVGPTSAVRPLPLGSHPKGRGRGLSPATALRWGLRTRPLGGRVAQCQVGGDGRRWPPQFNQMGPTLLPDERKMEIWVMHLLL